MNLEQISNKTCVYSITRECEKPVCPYRDQQECEDYKAVEKTQVRFKHLRLYKI